MMRTGDKPTPIFPFPGEFAPMMPAGNDLMTSMMKTASLGMPGMISPMGAAAAATALGFGFAAQMAGIAAGAMQGAFAVHGRTGSLQSDLGWMMPPFAGGFPAAPAARSATVVDLKSARKPAAEVKKPASGAPTADAPAPTDAPAKAEAAIEAAQPDVSSIQDVVEVAAPAPVPAPTAAKAEGAAKTRAARTKSAPAAAQNASAPAGNTVLSPEDFRRPADIEKPGQPDDLKRISGVGPKLEQVLNGLGVWTFAQIAAWTPEEVAWVDDYLQFRGRIGRDDWIAQAAGLVQGKQGR